MFYSLILRLASKRFTTSLFISGAFITALTAFFFILGFKLNPFFYALPMSLWAILFFTNLISCLVTDRYRDVGNYMCHLALFLIFAGIIVTYNTRFTGIAKIYENRAFLGEENDYLYHSRRGSFEGHAPDLNFHLSDIVVGYWDKMFLFTKMNANIAYPVISKDNESTVTLNSGPHIGGARINIKNFGYYPDLEVRFEGNLLRKGIIPLLVYPYGHGDTLSMEQHRIEVDILPDSQYEKGQYVNKSFALKKPVMEFKVYWLDKFVATRYLKEGEVVQIGKLGIKFNGVKKWVDIRVVKDRGEKFVFLGFIMFAIGLLLRYVPEIRKRF